MATNKLSEHYISRYTAYLTDVLDFLKTHGSLRRYSYIARKHGITHISKELFYETELYRWVDKPLTREKVIEVITRLESDSLTPKQDLGTQTKTDNFEDGGIIAWDYPNCPRQYAFIGKKNDTPYSVLMIKDQSEYPYYASCLSNKIHSDVAYVAKTKAYTVKPNLTDYKIMVDILCHEIHEMQKKLDKMNLK